MSGSHRHVPRRLRVLVQILLVGAGMLTGGCHKDEPPPARPAATTAPSSGPARAAGQEGQVAALGSVEVTARLVEVPEGAIFRRELYDYAAILKYEVLETHRGRTHAQVIYVGQYNPFKPRNQAADRKIKGIGGTVQSFAPGAVHRLALETPLEDYFMGGIVNKYFGQQTGPLYWALWTNAVAR